MKEYKIIFRERLTSLKELADSRDNILTKAEIREHFEGALLDDSHFEMLFEYLKGQNIQVADTDEEAREARMTGKQGSLSLYLSELEALEGADPSGLDPFTLSPEGATLELFEKLADGEPAAREKLAELYLPVVCELAREYEGKEIPVEDLIQEGNVGLLLALDSMERFGSLAACQAHILNGVSRAIEAAAREGSDIRKMGEQLAGRANRLREAVRNLEEELEHKVSIEELSAYLDMPVEEIRDILRITGDAIELGESGRK